MFIACRPDFGFRMLFVLPSQWSDTVVVDFGCEERRKEAKDLSAFCKWGEGEGRTRLFFYCLPAAFPRFGPCMQRRFSES